MSSPYATTLLQQPATVGAAPQAPAHTRHVTHVVAQPQPMYMPIPAQPAPARGGSAVTGIALALVVLLIGAIALVGAYFATTQASPSAREAAVIQNTVARDAFRDGRTRGITEGRGDAASYATTSTAMRASIARQNAYNAAYDRGFKAGKASYRAPRYTGGYGSRGYRGGGFGGWEVPAALGQAQHIANMTGAPVDVEVY